MNSSAYMPEVLVFQVNVTRSPIDLTSEILFAKTFRFSRILNLGSTIFPNGIFLLSMKLLLAGTYPRKTFTKQSQRNLIKFESAPVKIDLQWRLFSICFNIHNSFSFIFKRCDNCF